MTLPTSGPISINDIRAEMGNPNVFNLKGLCELAGFAPPYAISRFYGFTAGTVPTPTITASGGNADGHIDISISPAFGTPTGVTWSIRRSTVSGGPHATIGTTTSTSFTDNETPDGTTYYYVVIGTKMGWRASEQSNEASAMAGFAQ